MKNHLLIAGALCCALSTSAFAVDLTLNQKQIILMPDGKTSKKVCVAVAPDGKSCNAEEEETVGSVAQFVLTYQVIDPQTRQNDPKNGEAGALAVRIWGKETVDDLKLAELEMIIARVEKLEDPVTIARMKEVLEPLKENKK